MRIDLRGVLPVLAVLLSLASAGCARHILASGKALSASQARGKAVYAARCAACHGIAAAGDQIGPPLTLESSRKSAAQIVSAIKNPTPPMPKLYPASLSEQDVADVAAYVESL